MTKRIITVVCEINQPKANWIWKQHMSNVEKYGICSVNSISNGNMLEEKDRLEKVLAKIHEVLDGRSSESQQIDQIKDLIEFDKQ